MTQDEIIEMADKADEEADKVLNMKGEYHPNWHQVRDEIFAKLVATNATEREREACARVVLGIANDDAGNPYKQALRIGAEAIRARGQHE